MKKNSLKNTITVAKMEFKLFIIFTPFVLRDTIEFFNFVFHVELFFNKLCG